MPGRVRCRFRYGSGGTHGDDGRNPRKLYGCGVRRASEYTGLACDPVGNRVEWPCLGKNIMGGSNALASANMILAGYDKVIPAG